MRRFLPFVVIALLMGGLYLGGATEYLERGLVDARFRLVTRPASSSLVLVAIDPRSLRALDVWPWARGCHATLLEQLIDAGADRVAFDIDFSSRSIPEEDAELEGALAAARGRVVLPVFRQVDPDGGLTATAPHPRFRRSVTLGTINVRPGSDGLARRYWARDRLGDEVVPSFAASLIGDVPQKIDDFYVDFGIDVASVPMLSYVDVLTRRFDPDVVRGKTVVVGSTARELGDQIAVPLYKAIPGPLLQALAYESIVQDRALARTGAPFTLTVTLLLAVALGPWIGSRSWRSGLGVVVGFSVVAFAAAIVVQSVAPCIVEIAPWMLTLAVVYGFTLVRRIDQQALRLLIQGVWLRRTEDLMHHVVENSFDAIVTVREDGVVDTLNAAAERLFGCSGHQMVGRPIGERVLAAEGERAGETDVDPLRPGVGPYEAVGLRDGVSFPVEMTFSALTTDGESRRVAFLRDITERKAQRTALEHQATHDALTDLPNRLMLGRRVREALSDARENDEPVIILLLDLDRFKEINDTLGHHIGDLLLEKIAQRLRTPLRSSDTIARLGGDEFAVLLPATDLEEAQRTAWRLVRTLEEPFQIDGLSLQVDTSVGIAVYPEHGADAQTLIRHADVAMYVAKRGHSGVAVYHQEFDENNMRHLELTGALRHAIEDDQLWLEYQPKVAAASGRIVGAEALLRWRHPEHGEIPPDEFIALAEHSGLIRPLTRWVLEAALRDTAEWHRRGLDIGLSVNVSVRNLLENRLPANLERMLAETGVPAGSVSLEITESVIMEDPEKALDVLTELAVLGVGVSVDDFGTGYSSLGYLKKLPAREIKIDRSFVMEMDRNLDDATIVRSTIELAHNLGLEVVAEGVESREVWETLKELGCDFGQGYYFSKPMPAYRFLHWLGAADADLAV